MGAPILRTFEYKGRSIVVRLEPAGAAWTWRYVVDGVARRVCSEPPLDTPDLAFQEARVDAEMLIDGHLTAFGR